ncbi:MarR family winged helix-turn-helix transcriptional regulator [Streptomyces sp. NBC_00414]|uniref:MarR family winged helix-turn-helix transcriptional regulator n=1 Tax=Streptomyces sp. NBC_00414 TaxID=2975739 RepID=UPI002E1BEFF5
MEDRADGAAGGLTAAELADVFSRAAKVLARKFEERLDGSGASLPRSRVLVEVARLGPIRVTDVAAAVGIAQGTASTLLEALVRDGLVARAQDPADRRVTKVLATSEGARQADAWLQAYEAAAEDLFAALPRSRWPEFADLLTVLGGEE